MTQGPAWVIPINQKIDLDESILLPPTDLASFESRSPMEKRQLIDRIREYNQTATHDFLAQFDESALEQYLQHLEDAKARKRVISSWNRQGEKLKMAV
jgi:hypothetical protein